MNPKAESYGTQRIDGIEIILADGETETTAAVLHGTTLAGFYIPSGFSGANIEFQSSHNGVDFFVVYGATGSDETRPAAASRYIFINPQCFYGCRYLKLVSDVAQSGDITITCVPYSI